MNRGLLKRIRLRPTLPHKNHAVPSAQRGLTSEFGMGSGVALSQWPPEKICYIRNKEMMTKSAYKISCFVKIAGTFKKKEKTSLSTH